MDAKLTSVIAKVKDLLKLATSSNANEAAAAARAANKLIDQYRISESEIECSETNSDPLVKDDGYIYETGRVTAWKQTLVAVLAKHYGVAHFNDIDMSAGRKVSRFKLIGKQSDIQITRYMFNWLVLECQRLSDKEARGNGHVYVASYCSGFVAGISEQLKFSRKEVEASASSSAIVKLDSRFKEADAFMRSSYRLKNVTSVSHSRFDANGFDSGAERGKNIHLGKAMGSGPIKMLGK